MNAPPPWRDVGAAFYGALQLPRATLLGRLVWAVLLNLLRVPLLARLLLR